MNVETAIKVSGKIVGRTRPPFADWWVPLPPGLSGAEQLTLRNLITRIVLAEVEAFKARQEARRLTSVLCPDAIELAAAMGKVTTGGQEVDQDVDAQGAVVTALQAFEDGLYFVFVDDIQGEVLDQPVRVAPGSSVLFLRLVPLAGG